MSITTKLTAFAFSLLPLWATGAYAENVALSTPNNTIVLDITKGAEPKFGYYGQKLSAQELASLPSPTYANSSHLEVYPAYGATHVQGEVALAMRHADGNLSTQLFVEDYSVAPVADKAPNGKNRSGQLP